MEKCAKCAGTGCILLVTPRLVYVLCTVCKGTGWKPLPVSYSPEGTEEFKE